MSSAPAPDHRNLTRKMEETALREEDKKDGVADNDASANTAAAAAAMMPELPAAKKQSFEEIMADLSKTPLFMTELNDQDQEANNDIAALQALNYEGTPLENGVDFKMRGNDCFKVRGFVDAREFYTKGIQILAAQERKRATAATTNAAAAAADGTTTQNVSAVGTEDNDDNEEEVEQQRQVLEALYVNRAACHLELDNFRSCWLDCAAALRLNPANVKAYYRSARALLAVDRVEEAHHLTARGLALDPANAALAQTERDVSRRAAQLSEKAQQASQRKDLARRRRDLLQTALRARNIATRTTPHKPSDMQDARVELVPDPDDPTSSLVFPTVLLYPEHLETDFIKAFGETQTLEEHLGYVFPLPWDGAGAYTLDGVSCYVETKDGGVLKMGKRVPLLKVLATGKVEVVDEVARIYVLPNDKAEAWITKFKKAKAAEIAKARS